MLSNPLWWILVLVVIIIDIIFDIKNLWISIFLWIIKMPFIFLGYVFLFWFWAGDGIFNLITIPVSYLAFLFLQVILYKKNKEKSRIKKILINSMVFITPVLCIAITYLIAKIFNFEIQIH